MQYIDLEILFRTQPTIYHQFMKYLCGRPVTDIDIEDANYVKKHMFDRFILSKSKTKKQRKQKDA